MDKEGFKGGSSAALGFFPVAVATDQIASSLVPSGADV